MADTVATLAQLARARGLPLIAALLELDENRAVLTPPAAPDAILLADPSAAPLGHLPRRGLEPRLVASLLPAFAERPLERGLLAWDVLTGSLFGSDESELLAELRGYAKEVAHALPPPGQRCVNLPQSAAADLVAALAVPAYEGASTEALLDAVKDQALGAIARVSATPATAELTKKPEVLEAIRAFARLLRFAHAPTLASLYLDYLWRGLGYAPAFDDLCELCLDAEAAERIPLLALGPDAEKDPATARLLEYVLYRTGIQKKQLVDTYALLKQTKKKRESHWRKPPPDPPLQLVEVELGAYFREATVPFAAVDKIWRSDESWRYAAEMRIVAAAAAASPDSEQPLEVMQQYLENFGNRFNAWYLPLRASQPGAPWRIELGRYLAREALYLPHEREVWRALLPLIGSGDLGPAVAEIDARITAQSTL